MSGACETCGETRELRWLSGPTGAAGEVTVTFERLPVWSCPAGHERTTVDGVREAVLAQVDRELLVAARSLPLRPERCAVCGDPLSLPPRRTRRSVRTVMADVGEVLPLFELPMVRCPSDAKEQLPRAVARALPGAIDDALARVAHSEPPAG